ncbi:FAD-binding protein [Blastococcus brunescens]|uniref:FAD-binding protein n=1 Tax=Blastococcus brunescens TaxID=1564165 RepID=A0ABZ1B780_9ACTN|nr:FAD-binding protein [Blastococcus sp. BMG 8361]WRL66665.1 FAD-binding protein [Blastococcus sp. BMG 8361]
MKYGELVERLHDDGLALHNLASLPHISVAGAVTTATHGSGTGNGNLATAVAALEMVLSSGEIRRAERGDPDFDGLVVGLGALGVITRLTLDVEPAFDVRQQVFEGMSWSALLEHFDEVMSCGYSVSVFTLLADAVDMVWVKTRTDVSDALSGDLFRARPAPADRHPVVGLDPTPARRNEAGPAPGTTGCRTSAWGSRPAPARSCSRSTCCRVGTVRRRSRRCGSWPIASARCCSPARSGRWPPTGYG